MAGVGLELQKLKKDESYFGAFKVFGYALALSIGPWLTTIVSVLLITLIGRYKSPGANLVYLTSTIMYTFAGSLILSGPFFMMFSRYLADQTYQGLQDQRGVLIFVQGLVGVLSVVLSFVLVPFFFPQAKGVQGTYQFVVGLLFVLLSGIWTVLAYTDFMKRYATAFYIFLFGSMFGVLMAYFLKSKGTEGLLIGYTLGVLAIYLSLLIISLWFSEESKNPILFEMKSFLTSLRTHLFLGGIGLLYNLGIWVDKFVLWISVGEPIVQSRMKILPYYDIATFLAYLLMMPAISYFLVMIETEFYRDYRMYLDDLETGSLKQIEKIRNRLVLNMRRHLNYLFELEMALVVLAAFFGTYGLRRLGVDELTIFTYQVLLGAAFFQVLFWVQFILLLYFEFRKDVLFLTVFFVFSNAFLTWVSVQWGEIPYGFGYLASAGLTSLLAWVRIRLGLKNLHRHIFFIHSGSPTPN